MHDTPVDCAEVLVPRNFIAEINETQCVYKMVCQSCTHQIVQQHNLVHYFQYLNWVLLICIGIGLCNLWFCYFFFLFTVIFNMDNLLRQLTGTLSGLWLSIQLKILFVFIGTITDLSSSKSLMNTLYLLNNFNQKSSVMKFCL